MPSIMHHGKRYILKKKVVKCTKCNDVVIADEIGQKFCKCGEMSISIKFDVTCKGDFRYMEDMSIWVTEGKPREYLPQEVVAMIWNETRKKMLEQSPRFTDILTSEENAH